MRILHYSIGLFPNRTGGLNRYSTDLMKEQSKYHKVGLLYPCGYSVFRQESFISSPSNVGTVLCYKLVNALPVPLMYGIRNSSKFIGQEISRESFESFYNDFKPDVLHLHTLMGMPEQALRFFKEKNVRIIFTSHDYFGICPKVNFIDDNNKLCDGPKFERCEKCNASAPSITFLRVRNSEFILKLRDFSRWIKSMIHF